MDHKTAMQIIVELLNKSDLTAAQKEALEVAIGVLSWTSLRDGWKQAVKERREKELNTKRKPSL